MIWLICAARQQASRHGRQGDGDEQPALPAPRNCSRSIRSGARSATRRWRRSSATRCWRRSSIRRSSTRTAWKRRSSTGIAERLGHQDLGSDLIRQTFKAMLADRPGMGDDRARRHPGLLRPRPGLRPLHHAGALFQGLPRDPDAPAGALAVERRAARISRSICRAARRRSSRPTSIRPPGSARASSSTTPPASWSARRRSSRTMSRSCTA